MHSIDSIQFIIWIRWFLDLSRRDWSFPLIIPMIANEIWKNLTWKLFDVTSLISGMEFFSALSSNDEYISNETYWYAFGYIDQNVALRWMDFVEPFTRNEHTCHSQSMLTYSSLIIVNQTKTDSMSLILHQSYDYNSQLVEFISSLNFF